MTQWGLDTLFNPAKRHMDEEKQRLQSTREEIGDSSGGKRIDLESGKVTIPGRRGRRAKADADAAAAADDAAAAADDAAADEVEDAQPDPAVDDAETGEGSGEPATADDES